MLIHEHFGIPTPIVETNPYRLTAARALQGKVTLPEGPFAPLVAQYFRPWFSSLKEFLEGRIATTFPVIVEKNSAPRIRFRVSSYYVQQALELPLGEFDHQCTTPTLNDLVPFAKKNIQALQEFQEFLQHYMEPAAYARFCKRHQLKKLKKSKKS